MEALTTQHSPLTNTVHEEPKTQSKRAKTEPGNFVETHSKNVAAKSEKTEKAKSQRLQLV